MVGYGDMEVGRCEIGAEIRVWGLPKSDLPISERIYPFRVGSIRGF
jgi:hypothetical protein